MSTAYNRGVSYWAAFFILFVFFVFGSALAGVISLPIAMQYGATDLSNLSEYLKKPAFMPAAQLIQALSAICGFLLPAIFTARLVNRKPLEFMGATQSFALPLLGWGIVLLLLMLVASSGLAAFTELIPLPQKWLNTFKNMETDYRQMIGGVLQLKTTGQLILSLILVALLPAITEEFFFRGAMQNFLTKATQKPWLSIVVVSVIFSAFHFSYFGFLSRILAGFLLGATFYITGRLWLSVVLHFINNAIAVITVFTLVKQGKTIETALNDSSASLWGLLVLPVFFFIIFFFYKKEGRGFNQNTSIHHS